MLRLISRRRVHRAREAFNPQSGQVFSETYSVMHSMAPSWVTATTGSVSDLVNFRNFESVGAACLEQIALRSVLLQLDNLDHQTLACVPWVIGKKIWAHVRHFRLDSLRTWRLFVRAYPEERDAFQETRKVPLLNSQAQYKFDEIVKQITAPKFEWITNLVLQDPDLSKADWGKLVHVQNLGVLFIIGPESTASSLDDRVVRGWGGAAEENNAFPRLRATFFICQMWITERSLHHLRKLPALTLCNLTGCDVDLIEARDSGWRHRSGLVVVEGRKKSGQQNIDYAIRDEVSHELNIEWAFSANPHDAMRAYYRRATSPSLSPKKAELNEEPVLSVYKRTTESPITSKCNTNWFLRNVHPTNHGQVMKEAQATTKPPKKKRKLRTAKERNLENVLGGFGM